MGIDAVDTSNNQFPKKAEQQIEAEMTSIRKQAVTDRKLVYNSNGVFEYGLTPNGEKSRLSEKQWLQTRTGSFKQWFGDWELDKEGASKIVDENGEPMVLYHGTSRTFDRFDATAPKTFEYMDNTRNLFYLASDKDFVLEEYAQFKQNLII